VHWRGEGVTCFLDTISSDLGKPNQWFAFRVEIVHDGVCVCVGSHFFDVGLIIPMKCEKWCMRAHTHKHRDHDLLYIFLLLERPECVKRMQHMHFSCVRFFSSPPSPSLLPCPHPPPHSNSRLVCLFFRCVSIMSNFCKFVFFLFC